VSNIEYETRNDLVIEEHPVRAALRGRPSIQRRHSRIEGRPLRAARTGRAPKSVATRCGNLL
jgi:hypothetical protein